MDTSALVARRCIISSRVRVSYGSALFTHALENVQLTFRARSETIPCVDMIYNITKVNHDGVTANDP